MTVSAEHGEPPDTAPSQAEGEGGNVELSARRVPDFFIAGHQKCGTTALYEMLSRHPQIFMSPVKEPRYFCTDIHSRFAPRTQEAKRLRTLDGYLSLFDAAEPGQLAGEASPQYLRSRAAPARDRGGAARREDHRDPARAGGVPALAAPADGLEQPGDREGLRPCDRTRAGAPRGSRDPAHCQHPDVLLYTDHVRYVEQLSRFREAFGAANVHVIIYDDFRRDNETTVREVLRFLGADDTLPVETIDTKPLKAVRSLPLHRLANAARVARNNPAAAGRVGRAVNALTPELLRGEAARGVWRRAVYRPPAAPDEAFMRELRSRVKGEVQTLSDYLGRDLISEWGYDRLD